MGYTKQQVSNYINGKILFRFQVDANFIIDYSNTKTYTFDEFEKITQRNLAYWESIGKNNTFKTHWENLNSTIKRVREYFSNLESLDIDSINSFLINNVNYNYETISTGERIYPLSIASPISEDGEIRKIRDFFRYYLEKTTDNQTEALNSYIYLYKNNHSVGQYLSYAEKYRYYPALYHFKKEFSNIREDVSNFTQTVVNPVTEQLNQLSSEANEKYSEIVKFSEEQYSKIKQEVDAKSLELIEFQDKLNAWQADKQAKLSDLEETYNIKLSFEEPEKLWNKRANEYRTKAKYWSIGLGVFSTLMIIAASGLVFMLYQYPIGITSKIPFISQSFIFISVISFLIYIIRVLIKIVMSNHHIATEYEQKAALTRFYQSLTYSGINIDKDERLIIVSALFSRVETGLIKTEGVSDSEALLAVIAKNISK